MMFKSFATTGALALGLLCMGGCSAEPEPTSQPASEAQQALKAEETVKLPRVPKVEPSLPLVGDLQPVPVEREVNWGEALAGPQIASKWLDAAQRDAAAGAPIPVLLPAKRALVEEARIMTGPHWMAVNIAMPEHYVYVHGTRVAHVVPGLKLSEAGQAIVDREFVLTRNEGIATLSFKSFGVAYSIDVGCEAHTSDPRCVEDDYIMELANSLAVVGGAR